jgi:hypothetical protein
VKLGRELLFCFCSVLFPVNLVFSQADFPARGFSSILDDVQAQAKLDAFKDGFYSTLKEGAYHQAYLYRFEFTHFPPKGTPATHHGLLSGPYPNAPILRIDLVSSSQDQSRQSSFLLHRDQEDSRIWKWNQNNKEVSNLLPKEWLLPWKEGVNHTPFDLLMPFLQWPFEYEKSGRVCGRPAHLFLFSIPPNQEDYPSTYRAIRLAIDDAYNAPLRIEHMDGGILPARVFSLQSFKKLDDHWVVKGIDVKDRDTKSRTRFELKAYAHDLDLSPSVFQVNGLSQSIFLSSISLQPL